MQVVHEVNVAEGDVVRCGAEERAGERGGEWMGWFVPNNDIGYLICNRRQYRLATPHFIPPARPCRPRRVLSRSGVTLYILYVPVYMDLYIYRAARQGCR